MERYYDDKKTFQEQIHYRLVNKALPSKLALLGMGGTGKSQLALAYARRHKFFYVATLWINMANPTASIKEIAKLLKVEDSLDSVHQWLRQQNRLWLLVLDNADTSEELAMIKRICVPDLHGHIIATSRNRSIMNFGATIDVNIMRKAEAIKLLICRVRGDNIDERSPEEEKIDLKEAEGVVEVLGCLALAVELAGAYIGQRRNNRPSISWYLEDLAREDQGLLEYDPIFSYERESAWASAVSAKVKAGLPQQRLQRTLVSAWSCSVEYLRERFPNSLSLLQLLCYLNINNLDADLFRFAVENSPLREHSPASSFNLFEQKPLTKTLSFLISGENQFDMKAFEDAVMPLQQLSLISVSKSEDKGWAENPYRFVGKDTPSSDAYQIHGVICKCVQILIGKEAQRQSLGDAMSLLSHTPVEFIHSSEISRVIYSGREDFRCTDMDVNAILDWQHRKGFQENLLPHFEEVLLNCEALLPEANKAGALDHLAMGQRFMLVFVEYGDFLLAGPIWNRMSKAIRAGLGTSDKLADLQICYLFAWATKAHSRARRWTEANQDMDMTATLMVHALRTYDLTEEELSFLLDCLLSIWAQTRFLDMVPSGQNVVKLMKTEWESSDADVEGLQTLIDTIGQILEKEFIPNVPANCNNDSLKSIPHWVTWFTKVTFMKLVDRHSDYDDFPATTE